MPSHAPESYLHDKAFRQQLADLRTARDDLERVRSRLVKELEKKFEARRLALGVACANGVALPRALDEKEQAQVRAALADDPEWKDLCQRCTDANQAMRDNQRAVQRIVRERIAPKAGKSVGKNISK